MEVVSGNSAWIYPNTDALGLTWTSSDSSIVLVAGSNDRAHFLARSPGTATITAKAANGDTATCIVKVLPDDVQEPTNDEIAGAVEVSMGETVSTHKIYSLGDVDWFKVCVPSSQDYRLRVTLFSPEKDNSSEEYAILSVAIYSGTSENTLVGVGVTGGRGRSVVTARRDDYSGNRWFYVRVASRGEDNNFSTQNPYQLQFATTNEPYAGEVYGWSYCGSKREAPLNYRLSDGMSDTWRVENGVAVTYADLFQEAIARWNALDLMGNGEPIFGINSNPLSPYVKAKTLNSSTNAITMDVTKDIELNTNNLSAQDKTRIEVVDTICHELGHTLGLADLYIDDSYNFEYNGKVINNKDHLMYGYSNRTLTGTGIQRFHSNDLFGVKTVQNWMSLEKYEESDLYAEAGYIVRGKVISTQDYESNEQNNDTYSRVHFAVEEYLYAPHGIDTDQLSFLQLGTADCEFAVDPIYKAGEEYILFLHYDLYGELFVVGGPQGRYSILQSSTQTPLNTNLSDVSNCTIINQIDKYVQESTELPLSSDKDFSKELTKYLVDVKNNIVHLK